MKKIFLFMSVIFLTFSTDVFAQPPSNLLTTNITLTSADLSWVDNGCGGNFVLQYRIQGSSSWTLYSGTVTNPLTLVGLSANTDYDWRVKCAGSAWSAAPTAQFSTIGPTISNAFISIPILCNGGFASDEMQIDILQTSPSTVYKCLVGTFIGSSFFLSYYSTNETNTNQLNLPGFFPNTDYFVRIVDSAAYYAANGGGGSGMSMIGVYDQAGPINFSEPAQLAATTSSVASNLCPGDCIAEESLSITGGTGPYSFTLDAGLPVNLPAGSSSYSFASLCANVYELVVTDANGCSTETLPSQPSLPDTITTFTIAPISPIIPAGTVSLFNLNGFNVSCNGVSDGTITAIASGGTGSFTYSIDGTTFQSSSIFSGLSAGAYTVTYRDANGCDTTETLILNEPPALSGIATVTQNVSCYAFNDGLINFDVDPTQPGTPAYLYSLDNGITYQTSPIFPALFGDSIYDVMIEDNNGCQFTDTAYVSQPAEIIPSASSLDYNGFGTSCNGASDGEINASAIGGSGLFKYSLDGITFQTSGVFSGLSAGIYTITYEDTAGCLATETIDILAPNTVSLEIDSANSLFSLDCFGDSLGVVSVSVSGGTGFGTYWFYIDPANPQNDSAFYGLPSGSYFIYVYDASGCSDSIEVQISEPAEIVFTLSSTNLFCNGDSTGTAEVATISGGTAPYFYSWNTGDTTNFIGGLSTGNYWVSVTDINGCVTYPADTIGVSEPTSLTTSTFSTLSWCAGTVANGTAAVSVSGGTPFTVGDPYTYLWDTLQQTYASWPSVGFTTDTITLLPAGTYTVIATDSNGCSAYDTVAIQPEPLPTLSFSVQNTSCFGYSDGSITPAAAAGTPPYEFSINGGSTWQSPPIVYSGTPAGSYFLTVRDDHNCVVSDSVFVLEPAVVSVDTTIINHVSCYGGSNGEIIVDASGGTPFTSGEAYTYDWINQATGLSIGQINDTIINLLPGTYTCTITDSIGCPSITTGLLTVVEPLVALIVDTTISSILTCFGDTNGIATVFVSGGTPFTVGDAYTYLWSDGQTNDTAFNLSAGTYTCTITDSAGCDTTQTIIITEPNAIVADTAYTNITCHGLNDGTAAVFNVSGGTPFTVGEAYTYSWADTNGFIGQTNDTAIGLSGGIYYCTITDSLGCDTVYSVTVIDPLLVTASDSSLNHVTCYGGSDGTAIVFNVSGGTPFTFGESYTYDWVDQSTNLSIGQANDTAINLSAGTYDCTITDSLGCDTVYSVTIIDGPSFAADTAHTNITCHGLNDGTAAVFNVSGGTPFTVGEAYTYSWADTNGFIGQTNDTAIGLSGGIYYCTITDSLGCDTVYSVTVIDPPLVTAQTAYANITCHGYSDGIAAVFNVTGGTPFTLGEPYSYSWFDANGLMIGQINDTITGLSGGTYYSTITDSLGCDTVYSIVVIDPDVISFTATTKTNITCYGLVDGTATANPIGGTPAYTYSWSNLSGLIGQTTNTAVGLPVGTYYCTISDINNCPSVITDSISIIEPDILDIDSTYFVNASCYGANDGEILAIDVSGGTAPFEYSVDGSTHYSNMAYFNGYAPGTYTVEVYDSNNCVAADYIIITEPTDLVVDIITSQWVFNSYQIKCNGDSSGFADLSISGGNSPYTTNLYNSIVDTLIGTSILNSFSNLISGEYEFEVVDSNGCIYSEIVTFAEPDSIVYTFSPTHLTCAGWNDGAIDMTVTGGVGSATTYSYLWSPGGETTYSLDSLSPGVYTITVTDELGCEETDSVEINATNTLDASVGSITNVTCFDDCNGELSVIVSGGNPFSGSTPYTYSWNDFLGNSTDIAVGLCVDSISLSTDYYCVVSDADGCMDTVNFTLTQPAELEVDVSILNQISCNGVEDGKLQVDVSGGTANYNYTWSNGQTTINTSATTDIISGLSDGIYKITIEDANICRDTFEIYLNEPIPVEVAIEEFDIACFGNIDGYIQTLASGGTSFEYTYLYTLYQDGLFSDSMTHEAGAIIQDSLEFMALSPGTYYVIAEDRNGCRDTSLSVEITDPFEPISLLVDTINETCLLNDGVIRIFPEGGSQTFNYFINGIPTLNNSNVVGGYSPGYYTITVTDTRGCQITDSTFIKSYRSVFLDPDTVAFIDTTICLGQSIAIDVDERPNLQYVWDDGFFGADRMINPDTVLPYGVTYTGYYILTITDANNCEQDNIVSVTISSVEAMPASNPTVDYGDFPIVLAGEQLQLYSENNTCVEYTWQWSNNTISNNNGEIFIDDLQKTDWYYLHVRDSEGCLGLDSIYVVVGVRPYEAITPNNDGFNDTWVPLDIESYENALVQVFNRWGGLVFESKGGAEYQPWDGTQNGKELAIGTYYYIIDLNIGNEPQTGPITIIR